jgi:hypothetical protein
MATPVEGLYHPLSTRMSVFPFFGIGSPPPPLLPRKRLFLPFGPKGGSNTSLRMRWGGPNSDDLTESLALGGGLHLFHFLSLLSLDTRSFDKLASRGGRERSQFQRHQKGFVFFAYSYFCALGRVIESPHPLKDNYKLKETVHIPGARCLYLKFDSKERHLSVLYN